MFSFLRKYGILKSEDPTKKAIIDFLRENEKCTYGEIIKNLSLSSTKGMKIINEMKEEGIISNKIVPPFYQLAGDSK
jgi:hypothetical protein